MAKKQIEEQDEIDAIDVTHAVAEEIAAELIAEDIEKEHVADVSAKQEREQLIAEACRLQGRVEGLDTSAKFANVSALLQLKKIKEEKIYKSIPNIGTWENFCQSIGFSRAKVDMDLENLETYGSEFLLTVSTFGIGYRELRQLKRAKSDGTLAIESDSVIIGGEEISLSDKEELKDALERVITAKDKEIESHVKNKDRLVKEKQQAYDEADENKELLKKAKTELEKLKTATLNGITPEDRPAYNNIKACEDKLAIVHKNLLDIADSDLSDFNGQLLGGVIMMMFQIAEDVRFAVNAKGGAYFERLYLTDAEMAACGNMLTPSRLNKNIPEV